MSETRRILVIDDTPTMRLIVTGMLEDLGFKKNAQAESAEMGFELLRTETFDLILVDWNMSGRSGIEFIRTLRSHDHLSALPIVMMTSNNDPRQIHEAKVAGVSSYLVKPFGPLDLKERMNEAFQAAGA